MTGITSIVLGRCESFLLVNIGLPQSKSRPENHFNTESHVTYRSGVIQHQEGPR